MAKPDPALLDPAGYPHICEVTTRYADLDPNNHINNVAMAAIIEDARVRFHMASGFAKAIPAGAQIMVVSLTIDYLAQAHYPHPLVIHSGLASVGERSLRLRHLLVQNGRPVALAEAVAVHVVGGKAVPLPETLRGTIEAWKCR
ncbi:acyl-CoA thioesterase [Novosphingobium sp. KACC 22771]|uniref:acyl-CoA thioesterase n=1 Tax=Novosphingobium sp. KACC 22771 TaxID=3025670 RepID=UPI002365B1F5|nr:thioesterase family protein [Novosphingobium sp. KACC 22771]WDF72729.1 thioesterase family protein [Novosphingobium sp. KACC 22771]